MVKIIQVCVTKQQLLEVLSVIFPSAEALEKKTLEELIQQDLTANKVQLEQTLNKIKYQNQILEIINK